MPTVITKQLAEIIADKLEARKNSKKNRPHDLYTVSHNGIVVARFGIRRGSKRDAGHDHIPGQIRLRPREAHELAICNHDRAWWIQEMQARGVIPQA